MGEPRTLVSSRETRATTTDAPVGRSRARLVLLPPPTEPERPVWPEWATDPDDQGIPAMCIATLSGVFLRMGRPKILQKLECSLPDCSNEAKSSVEGSLCPMHYRRQQRHGDVEVTLRNQKGRAECSEPDCSRPSTNRGLCAIRHGPGCAQGGPPRLRRRRRTGRPSSVTPLTS